MTTPTATAIGTRRSADGTGAASVLAELGLLCVGIATAITFSRLFVGWTFLAPLAGAVALSWVLAVLTRRAGAGVWASALISLLCAVFAITWRFAPHSTAFGLPTPDTASTLLDAVHGSFARFSTLVAPVPVTDGFLAVLVAVLWAFTFFADTAAFRYRGPVQAVVPYISAFIAGGVLSRSNARLQSAVVFLAGLAVYALTQRVLRSSEQRWVDGDARRGTRSIAATGLLVALAALCLGAVVGPRLPGDTDAVVDLRSLGRASGPRTVTSPFVGVRNLLGPRSNEILFTARTPTPRYWRLTSLDRYDPDRDIWVSSTSYRGVDGHDLAAQPKGGRHEVSTQDVTVSGLTGPWLPAAFSPRSIDIDTDVSFDERSSSIIVDSDRLQVGTTYRVTSDIADVRELDLTATRRPGRSRSEDVDLTGVPDQVRSTARRIAGDQPTPYLQAVALQNWFRDSFTYDTEVDYSGATDPLAEFLGERRGFCAQFSSTFALMARSLGLAARVAVGFTPGDLREDPSGAATYVVRGRHAHAWPEVYFDGVGWVAFEPTPGRGNPGATDYTGVPFQQADPPPSQTTTTLAAPNDTTPPPTPNGVTTTVAAAPATTTTVVPPGAVDAGAHRRKGDEHGGATQGWVLAAIVVAALAAATWAATAPRRRRHRTVGLDDVRIADAWRRATADLAAIGLAARPTETPNEFAARVATAQVWRDPPPDGSDDGAAARVAEAMQQLGIAETTRRYGRIGADTRLRDRAEASADVVHDAVRSVATTRQRVRQLVR